jgi:hypothetical protein
MNDALPSLDRSGGPRILGQKVEAALGRSMPALTAPTTHFPPIDPNQAMACFVMRVSRTSHNAVKLDCGKCLVDFVELTKLFQSALKGECL